MICDEAQKIKSPSAIVTKAAKAQNAEFKIACTGTPVENSLADLWCLFDFIQPGFLGALNDFSRTYRRPIEVDDTSDLKEKERIKSTIEELRAKISDQTLRRTKIEMRQKYPAVISLKDKIEDLDCRKIPLSSRQRELYTQAIEIYKQKRKMGQDGILDPRQAGAAILGMLHHLRQICADPRPMGLKPNLSVPLDEYYDVSPKMKWLINALTKIQRSGEKVLIFTEFKDIQLILRHYIHEEFGFRPEIINGDPIKSTGKYKQTRQNLIDKFQASEGFNVLILSPVAVGFGVNIQAAIPPVRIDMIDYVFRRRRLAVVGGRHNPMDSCLSNIHVPVLTVWLPKSPQVIVSTGTLSLSGVTQNGPVITNRILLVVIDTFHLTVEIILIDHGYYLRRLCCHEAQWRRKQVLVRSRYAPPLSEV
jgi:SNF2 family DNA or RNA helicase